MIINLVGGPFDGEILEAPDSDFRIEWYMPQQLPPPVTPAPTTFDYSSILVRSASSAFASYLQTYV